MKLSRRGIGLILAGLLGFLAIAVMPDWLQVCWRHYVPRWLQRGAVGAFLQTTRGLYLLALTAAPLIAAVAGVRLVRARRRGTSASWSARVLVSSVTVLVLMPLCELIAGRSLNGNPVLPDPVKFADDPDNVIDLVVVGESTAGGWPFQPKFSAAQLVAWQLERVLPDRRVRLDTQAVEPGSCLEQVLPRLKRLRYRPDMMLVCAGHNEFQARFGWPRRPWHYADTRSAAAGAVDWAGGISNVLGLLNRAIDLNQLDVLPAASYQRELVDSPCCTPSEYARVLGNYRRDLEALATWCEKLGVVLVVIVPPSNLGSFPPSRSYLAIETPAADREAFAQAFMKAASRASHEPAAAEAEFRRLLAAQPAFAEAHYRLARLMERRGAFEEAESHYRLARDCDGMPLRLPSDFGDAAREVCRLHPNAVLVDGPEIFRRLSPHRIANDDLMHDAQHPKFRGHLVLGEDAVAQLAARRAFGWPKDVQPHAIEVAECVAYFGIERSHWESACVASARFYEAVAGLRYDPDVLVQRSVEYLEAARRIAAGEAPAAVGIVGLAVDGPRD